MTGIINYGAGNIFSVIVSIRNLHEEVMVVSKPEMLRNIDRIILPGVGAFDHAMKYLKKTGLSEAVKEEIKKGKFLLGICLGLQMFFEHSEEGKLKGLGLIKGEVRKLPGKENLPVPHMGWNTVNIIRDSKFLKNLQDNSFFYFAHSFYCVPEEKSTVVALTSYGIEFASVVQKDNIIGVQFHPEKSAKHGLRLLKNFLRMK
ncbi:MAG TPA: imidazole glycerol phosphate synthase subunit HisH [bacterium]|nr:imidazole glycerol phosphate synthase subunit HisH [bacterium]HOL34282.1 imidazole glycerol phosphate synthase subunit HisH [bacterium]HPP07662.1 imidazole glycerol phosphate synthase subunit HisH [bacterium]